ncbi:carbamoyltransferase C-terminal domain-containing protein [Ralstonia pseudosolanacearum]|uniref:carbamoyltransferase C-terminal domain-containing protein n=1 Tax=Ralstonia pseudosolanacearum TaxID=1310165 RepID=UPI0018D109D4|nr:carbamoyltransferase C-terminal domain-containing protein [Ralstonia pseudosolanacearum]MCD9228055.1 proline dehydrogenase [Ralstonia pseudosolanacearum]
MMRLLAMKPGHDGNLAYIANGQLEFSFEAEKDSGNRYAPIGATELIEAMRHTPEIPEAIVISGWSAGVDPLGRPIGAGYMGLEPPSVSEISLFGQPLKLLSSSHERAHLMGAYALSPFPQGQPCYALIWEGHIGAFYSIDAALGIECLAQVMVGPGIRYAFAYGLADPSFGLGRGQIRLSDAGKLMALAAFEGQVSPSRSEKVLLDRMFADPQGVPLLHKSDFHHLDVYNSGVESEAAKRLARLVSDRVFDTFFQAIKPLVKEKRPLLIGGGCGLNCEWNRSWLDSGLFSDVFIPPCTNDVGSALGSAADAQWHLTGRAKLAWNVYCGQAFVDDAGYQTARRLGPFARRSAEMADIADTLRRGGVLGWVAGRAEMGPRALGNRSILAAPFEKGMLDRLNAIKRREGFRPIAPVCLEEDVSAHFDLDRPSPYMLYFCRVRSRGHLQAITHVDGSSRVQSVNAGQNPLLYRLLSEFKAQTHFGVLCNTSLNFNGTGFINRTSDLVRYAQEAGLDGFVVEGVLFSREQGGSNPMVMVSA